MRANTVTVSAAIKRYYVQIVVPFFGIMFLGFGLGAVIVKENGAIGASCMVGGVVLAVVLSLIAYSHWIVWAFHNVDKPHALYQAALRRNLIKPKSSFYNKFNITFTVDKNLYDQAWEKMFEVGDLSDTISNLPINRVVEVKYSTKSLMINVIVLLIMVVGYAFLVSYYDTLPPKGLIAVYAGPIALIGVAYETYKLNKNQGKTAFVFRPEHLVFFDRELPWSSILTFQVFVENKNEHKVTIAAQTSEVVDGKGTMYSATKELTGLDATPDRIEELYSVYKELYAAKA